jgi:DNA-binding transcriptional LysR family regulator
VTDWDDLRFFLAVARAGSLSGAARALGVNHATVSRRLRALEARVGAQLFERRPDGWAPSEPGREMLSAALRIEDEIQGVDRRVSGRDARLAGPLRVAMSDLAAHTLLPQLRAFSEAFPEIALELTVSNHPSDLARREADVALRVTEAPAESLVGRRLVTIATTIYASLEYLERQRDLADLEAQAWLGLDGSLAEVPAARWMRQHVPRARIVARLDSLLLAYAAVRAGLGVALLPCVVGDADPELRRVAPGLLLRDSALWALTHADLRATGRVRAFLDFMRDAIAGMRERIEGRQPQAEVPRRRSRRAPRVLGQTRG